MRTIFPQCQDAPKAGSGSDSGIAIGWAVGGGVEWSITRAISIAAEYQHLEIGGNYNPTSNQQLFDAKGRVDFSYDQVVVRLNVQSERFLRSLTLSEPAAQAG